MSRVLLSVLLAFIAYSLLNIAQACQKIGLAQLPRNRIKGGGIWLAATLATSVSILIALYAVTIGNVSLVGAMAGTGLASLAMFSKWVMKEPSGWRELLGIGVILLGAALIGALSRESLPKQILLKPLYFLFAGVMLLFILSWLILGRRPGITGLLIGGLAGALGGFVPLFQKVSTSDVGRARALSGAPAGLVAVLANPFTVTWIVLSVLSMLVLQFSYQRGQAIRIIPTFTAVYISVPVLGGVLCFQEQLQALQWVGIALILSGVFILNTPGVNTPGVSTRKMSSQGVSRTAGGSSGPGNRP